MRTETLAVVFTDIKGYTEATSSQTHQENAKMLRRIERIIAPVVRAYNGRVVKSIGDAYMIVFDSPTEAVQCSTAVQDRLHQHNANTSADRAIHIRIAMNIGEVRVHRGDVFGEPVNIAARVESVTPADEIYLSEAIYLTMNRSDVPVEHVGEYELKGIPEPVTVYRVKKFAHLEDTADEEGENAGARATGLPFGGAQLGHWRRVRWLRRAYVMLWFFAVVGVAGAAYLRYRPSADYGDLVVAAKAAVERKEPVEVLALAGQIPPEAVQERHQVRRHRRDAVAQLLAREDYDTAASEIQSLMREDNRDPKTLMLKGVLLHERDGALKPALDLLSDALALEPDLAERNAVIDAVIAGYTNPKTRPLADELVAKHIQDAAVPAMARAITNELGDRLARKTLAARLEKLGAGDEVDWVVLHIEDLKSTSCKVRKNAINRLLAENDERAVGPLMRTAESKGCGSIAARRAAEAILSR